MLVSLFDFLGILTFFEEDNSKEDQIYGKRYSQKRRYSYSKVHKNALCILGY